MQEISVTKSEPVKILSKGICGVENMNLKRYLRKAMILFSILVSTHDSTVLSILSAKCFVELLSTSESLCFFQYFKRALNPLGLQHAEEIHIPNLCILKNFRRATLFSNNLQRSSNSGLSRVNLTSAIPIVVTTLNLTQ